MGLLKRKYVYYNKKIEKKKEVVKEMKLPEFVGTRPKNFCCLEHAENYILGVGNKKKSGGRRDY